MAVESYDLRLLQQLVSEQQQELNDLRMQWVAALAESQEAYERQADLEAKLAQRITEMPNKNVHDNIAELLELLIEAREDLAAHIDTLWPKELRDDYPLYKRRYENDMDLCYRIDTVIGEREL